PYHPALTAKTIAPEAHRRDTVLGRSHLRRPNTASGLLVATELVARTQLAHISSSSSAHDLHARHECRARDGFQSRQLNVRLTHRARSTDTVAPGSPVGQRTGIPPAARRRRRSSYY